MAIAVGDILPEITVTDHEGNTGPLRSLLGAAGAVLYFYPKDNTPGCTTEAREFQQLSDRFAAMGMSVLGVSRDSVKSHQGFRQKQSLTFTLLSDTSGELCELLGVWQEKQRCGKTCMGLVRSTFVLDGTGRVLRAYENVRAAGHAQKVLDDMAAPAGG
ncbi:MAG: peroxiredoxin [Magnetococcus sp. WYHC-3]